MVVMIAFTMMAVGLNIVVGYAGPARPRLRRLLRRRRLHGRLVRVAAVRPGDASTSARSGSGRRAGHPHLDVDRARRSPGLLTAARGHRRSACRPCACAATTSRSSRSASARSSRRSCATATTSAASTSRTGRSGSRRSTRSASAHPELRVGLPESFQQSSEPRAAGSTWTRSRSS